MTAITAVMEPGGQVKRKPNDLYETPDEATIALILAEQDYMPWKIWEPACGHEKLANVLRRSGRHVVCSDLVKRLDSHAQADFLQTDFGHTKLGIVTNPPFGGLAAPFIWHAVRGSAYVAFLLKAHFWNAAERALLFEQFPYTYRYTLTWRLDFTGAGRPHQDCAWFVWCRERGPLRQEILLKRPVGDISWSEARETP